MNEPVTSHEKTSLISRRDVAVAGLSLAVSGIGGAAIQRWVDRAKPRISVVSVGFDSKATVSITPELLAASAEDSWGDNLTGELPFEVLRLRYQDTQRLIEKHERALPIVDRWLTGASARLAAQGSSGPVQLLANELEEYPYVKVELMGSSLHGMINRLELGQPPTPDVSKFLERAPVMDRTKDGVTVQVQDRKSVV